MEFNNAQREAVNHFKGAAMVLAGPGSGKTTVITHRIKELIRKDVSPEKILVVTFTKAAAVHMQRKFFQIMEGEHWVKSSYPVSFGTFHGIYFRILKLSKNYSGRNILTENQKSQILREIIIRNRINTTSLNEFIQNIIGEISNVKGNMIPLSDYAPKSCKNREFKLIFDEYAKELKSQNKIDFDDMLLDCYTLFKEEPVLLHKWQQVFEYVLIDEFQDINKIQYEIIKMLVAPENNLFIVGDDDQSIYGFRGACPELMFRFEKDYQACRKIILNINYRSTNEIIQMSKNLIKNNSSRFEKNIMSPKGNNNKNDENNNENENIKDGCSIPRKRNNNNTKNKNNNKSEDTDVRIFRNQMEQLQYTAVKITELQSRGIDDIAILVRNNSQIDIIQRFLEEQEIISESKVAKKSVFKTQVGVDIYNYIKAAINLNKVEIRNNESLIYILNKPARLISNGMISDYGIDFNSLKNVYSHSSEIVKKIEKLEFDLQMLLRLKPMAALMYILKGIGYENYLKELSRERKINYSVFEKEIEEIKTNSLKYDTLESWILQESEENSANTKSKEKQVRKPIHIITMHGSKGLEFDSVFILDANQGIIPTSKAVRERDFAEERRLFYVAITRAKKYLNIYYVSENLGCYVEPSIFMKEVMA